ncbi:tyrosine-type recombinase/integrase [Chloroflexota bacterium]
MRGHIRKRGESWQIQVYIDQGKDGKPKRYFETVRGRKGDAQRRLTELLSSLDKGVYTPPGRLILADYLHKWLKDYVWPNLSPRTAEGYKHICNRHFVPHLGNVRLNGLKPEHLQHFYSSQLSNGLSAQTVRHHHTCLHKALQTAIEWGLLARNIADAVTPPRAQGIEMRIWDETEISSFLEAARKTRYFALFHTALFTAMRRSELLALR